MEHVLTKAGVMDLTPFGKFRVSGPDAKDFLDHVVANKIPAKGMCNLSHMLTPQVRRNVLIFSCALFILQGVSRQLT